MRSSRWRGKSVNSKKHWHRWLYRFFHPPYPVLILVSLIAYPALCCLFCIGQTEDIAAYAVYGLSAYALSATVLCVPRIYTALRTRFLNSRLVSSPVGSRYLHDRRFRAHVGIYVGMVMNFLYTLFRVVAAVRYRSAWFFSMAVYYLVLGGLRAYLAVQKEGLVREKQLLCYRRTATLLFLLHIPMGGMIFQMVVTAQTYSYPGYIIYLSALYTFYAGIESVVQLIRFHRMGDPVLSAAKMVNCIAAMMSVLGLQTAMLSRFSPDEPLFHLRMNAITGSAIYLTAMGMSLYMRIHASNADRRLP